MRIAIRPAPLENYALVIGALDTTVPSPFQTGHVYEVEKPASALGPSCLSNDNRPSSLIKTDWNADVNWIIDHRGAGLHTNPDEKEQFFFSFPEPAYSLIEKVERNIVDQNFDSAEAYLRILREQMMQISSRVVRLQSKMDTLRSLKNN